MCGNTVVEDKSTELLCRIKLIMVILVTSHKINHYSIELIAISTESVADLPISPPTTNTLLSGITTAKQRCLGVTMWLMIAHDLLTKLYL